MILDLLINLSITATLLFVAGKIVENISFDVISNSLKNKITTGLFSGLVGALLMVSTVKVTDTVIIDLRHLAMIIAAIFGGPIAAIISGIFIGIMRVALYQINTASIMAGSVAGIMGGIFSLILLLKLEVKYKMIIMNLTFVITSSVLIYFLIDNLELTLRTLIYYIPLSFVGVIFTYYMTEYIKHSNENHRSMMYYKLMADNSSDLISTHKLDGTYKFLSPSSIHVLGYKPSELLGKKPIHHIHPDDLNLLIKVFTKDQLEQQAIEYRFKRNDGTYCWLESTVKRIKIQTRLGDEYICISRLITDRKKIEEELNQSKERYSDLLQSMPDPMIVYKNKMIVFANEKAAKIRHVATEQLIGLSIYDFIHHDDQEKVESLMEILENSHQSVINTELKIQNLAGQVRIVNASSKNIMYDYEPAIQMVYRDITIQKKLERELQKAHTQFSFIIENSTDVMTIVDEEGLITYISPASELVFGYQPEEIIGTNAYKDVHPDDLQEVYELLHQAKNSEINAATIMYRYLRKDQQYTWIETTARIIRNNSQIESILLISRDITERKEKEQSLEESNKALYQLSSLDGLTGIPNRRFFDVIYDKEFKNAIKSSQQLSVILIDIDYFKRYNDEYGHLKGDETLIRVAKLIQSSLNGSNQYVARFGGEEFIVLLPELSKDEVFLIGQNIRQNINNEHILHCKSDVDPYVTISVGCATIIPQESNELEELIHDADQALYHAKIKRNQIVHFDDIH